MNAGMTRTIAALLMAALGPLAVATRAAAQAPPPRGDAPQAHPAPMRLTLDEAVRLGLENNLDIAVDRLEPDVATARTAQAASAFLPAFSGVFGRTHQVAPPTSLLIGLEGVTSNGFSSVLAMGQRLRWTGGTYAVSWTSTRQTTTSQFSSFSPSLGSQIQLSLSQPLLKDLRIDSARQQLIITRRNQTISNTRLRETVVRTLADVKRAYWDLVAARGLVSVQQKALDLARELVRMNAARVDVGQLPPLDLLSARAEEAQREENLVVAEVQARQAEDRLRLLILDTEAPTFWDQPIEPVDEPVVGEPLPDLDAVVSAALESRQDVRRAREELANATTGVRFYRSQRLPDLRLQASYGTTGIGGTRYIRSGGFPGTVTGTEITTFGNVLNQVFDRAFPTWSVGLTLSYPIGRSYEEAGLATARLQEAQARVRLQNLEIKAARQIRQAGWQAEANARRIATSRTARELAEQRLEAEQKRFEVGMSTSFLVIQAQRDLAQARNNELGAVLDYRRAIIDFESLQEAGPASGASGGSVSVSGSSIVSMPPSVTTGSTAGTASGTSTGSSSGRPGGM